MSRPPDRGHSRSPPDGIRRRDSGRGDTVARRARSRSRAPSESSLRRMSSTDAYPRTRQTFNSARSRPSSRDAPGQQSFIEQFLPADLLDTAVHLDPDNPGEFVIRHHQNGLVVQLDEFKLGKFQSVFRTLETKLSGKQNNRKTLEEQESSGDGKRFRISFAEVQRMRIRKLQCQLVRHVVKMRLDGNESSGWEETLKEYSKFSYSFLLLICVRPVVRSSKDTLTTPLQSKQCKTTTTWRNAANRSVTPS